MTAARSTRRSLLLSLTLALALLGLLAHQAPCQAGLVMRLANDVTATAGSSGTFDVVLYNDPTTAGSSVNISSYSLRLSLLGLSGVNFTNVQVATSGSFASSAGTTAYSSYIFRNGITTFDPGSPLSYDTFPSTSFTASDSEFDSAGSRTVGLGAAFGLVRVSYRVDTMATAGSGQLAFGSQPGDNSLADDSPNPQQVPFATQNGTFTINAGGAVPAPGSLVLGLIGLSTGSLTRLARRGRGWIDAV